mgnify:CR=1 FL=1
MTSQLIDELSHNGIVNDDDGKILLLQKPIEWTSFDIVKKVRNILREKKVGHCGTLDPKAEGLLILLTGRKTKLVDEFHLFEKEYKAEMILGERTSTFDSEDEVIEKKSIEGITEEKIQQTFSEFIGERTQIPPMFSAAKHDGKPLYLLARKGIEVERTPRAITIFSLNILAIEIPIVKFRVVCSKGTYIRSLVDEIGLHLGCGAYLKTLKRTRIGSFRLENALSIEQVMEKFPKKSINKFVISNEAKLPSNSNNDVDKFLRRYTHNENEMRIAA